VSASDIGRAWQTGVSNATTNVNVSSELTDVRNGFKRCKIILHDDDVSILLRILLHFKE